MRPLRSAPFRLPLLLPWALVIAMIPMATGRSDDGADGHFNERSSSHFQLFQDVDIDRYSGPAGSREFERNVLAVLEGAYRRTDQLLRIRPKSRTRVVVYDARVFDLRFGSLFGFRAAGFFDGVIHVRGGVHVDERLVRTLYHEYAHAALAWAAGGVVPAWLNEGLAEYLEAVAIGKRHLSFAENGALARAAQDGTWIPLEALASPSFAHLGGDDASLAYLQSYALLEHLLRRGGDRKLRSLVEELGKTRSAARALDRVYRSSLTELEQDLLREIL